MNSQQWTSKLGFVLAAAGSAIGLGAIWKFPYMAGIEGRRVLPYFHRFHIINWFTTIIS